MRDVYIIPPNINKQMAKISYEKYIIGIKTYTFCLLNALSNAHLLRCQINYSDFDFLSTSSSFICTNNEHMQYNRGCFFLMQVIIHVVS